MQKVEIGKTGISTTRIGFGCSVIMGSLRRRESLMLLEHAYDSVPLRSEANNIRTLRDRIRLALLKAMVFLDIPPAEIDEVRRAEFFRKGTRMRGLVKGKRWLLLTRWMNLSDVKRRELNQLFALNRKLFKAYLLKESLDRLWSYRYEGAMIRYLKSWMDQLRWQRLEPFRKLARMLADHLDGILNYCRTRVPMGVVEAVNGNIKSLLRRGRGYKNLRYLLLKAQKMAATRTEFCCWLGALTLSSSSKSTRTGIRSVPCESSRTLLSAWITATPKFSSSGTTLNGSRSNPTSSTG